MLIHIIYIRTWDFREHYPFMFVQKILYIKEIKHRKLKSIYEHFTGFIGNLTEDRTSIDTNEVIYSKSLLCCLGYFEAVEK